MFLEFFFGRGACFCRGDNSGEIRVGKCPIYGVMDSYSKYYEFDMNQL